MMQKGLNEKGMTKLDEKILKQFHKMYERALKSNFVKYPVEWSLFQTWKYFDDKRLKAEQERTNQ